MKAEFHPGASEEIVETTAYYEGEVPGLGNGFIAEVERVVEVFVRPAKHWSKSWREISSNTSS